MPGVRPVTLIGLAVPVADFVGPPSLDTHVAVYFGVVSGLPLACAAVRLVNVDFKVPATVFATVGRATGAGEPTTRATDGVEGGLVPRALVAAMVHVYVLAVVAPVTAIAPAVAPA